MKRRKFVLASGSTVLSGFLGSNMQRPAVALSFQISTPNINADPEDVGKLLMKFDELKVVPQYMDDSKQINIKVEAEIDGQLKDSKEADGINFSNGETIDLSKISSRSNSVSPLRADVSGITDSYLSGRIRVLINHPSISTQSYERKFNITSQVPSISTISKVRSASFGDENEGVAISKDGKFAYSPSENDNTIKEYSMSTAYNVNTLTKEGERSQSNEEGMHVELDGGSVIFGEDGNNEVTQVLMDNPFDLNSESGTNTLDTSSEVSQNQQAVSMAYDGSKFYTIARGAKLAQYTLDTKFDISSATKDEVFNLTDLYSFETDNLAGLDFGENGHYCVANEGNGTNEIYQWELSTPFDFSTATQINKIDNPEGDGERGIAVAGGYLYLASYSDSKIHQYEFN